MPDLPESAPDQSEGDRGEGNAVGGNHLRATDETDEERDEDPEDLDADTPDVTGPDPLRFNRWMKRSTTGAVLTGVALGLQQALERRDQRPPFVIEAPGEPEDEDAPIRLRFDPDDPSKTVAIVRSDDAGHEPGHEADDARPERAGEDQPDR